MKTKDKQKYCTIRKDILKQKLGVPIGNRYYFGAAPLPYRWKDDGDEIFQIKLNGKWQEAYSIDFEF